MTPNEPNYARERLSGASGQPFELTVAPDVEDFTRWTLANAERLTAEAADPPDPEP